MQISATLIVIFLLATLFFSAAIVVLYWATRSGQFTELEKTSRSIFNDEEPEGLQTDFFPGKNNKT